MILVCPLTQSFAEEIPEEDHSMECSFQSHLKYAIMAIIWCGTSDHITQTSKYSARNPASGIRAGRQLRTCRKRGAPGDTKRGSPTPLIRP